LTLAEFNSAKLPTAILAALKCVWDGLRLLALRVRSGFSGSMQPVWPPPKIMGNAKTIRARCAAFVMRRL